MKLRRTISLTSLLSFLLTVLTSVILYVVPHGRVAYWADWSLWGLSKDDWAAVHINLGILFLLALLLHILYNFKPMVNYLKNKAKRMTVFTADFNIALVLTILFTVGTLAGVPPFSTILDFSESIKEDLSKKYGEPPYGHAELSSLKTFARQMGLDLEEAKARLAENKVQVEADTQTISDIAKANGLSPQDVYESMKPEPGAAEEAGEPKDMPETALPGTGNRNLADLCHEYGLNIRTTIQALKEAGIEAEESQTLKEIAAGHDMSPTDVYEAIRQSALNQQ